MENDRYSIYIVLSHTGTVFSKFIKTYTKAEYTHASLGLNKELTELYSFGRKNPYNPMNGGFVQEQFTAGVFGVCPNTMCSVFELSVTKKEYRTIRKQVEKLKKRKDELSYSYLGLFGIMINTPIEKDDSYFCSHFVAAMLESAGIHLFDKPASMMTPKDFLNCPALTLIYEGRLHDYPSAVPLQEVFA